MASNNRADDLSRIRRSLDRVSHLVANTRSADVTVDYASNGDPVTTLDRAINRVLLESLPSPGEGWLSEESKDNPDRLRCSRVWVVDPIDGTREFVEGVPEWCVSVALVEDHRAIAGGILNPCTGEMVLGSVETGLQITEPADTRHLCEAGKGSMLVSRREHREGKWARFECPGMRVLPVGSIAYRLAYVAAGYAQATCTFEPRSEWDVAGGVALVLAAGGRVQQLGGAPVLFNQAVPLLGSFFAFGKTCPSTLAEICESQIR